MAEIISLFEHPDFDYPYGACLECDGHEWYMIVSPAVEDIGIMGFQCMGCGNVGIFSEEQDIIVFEMEE